MATLLNEIPNRVSIHSRQELVRTRNYLKSRGIYLRRLPLEQDELGHESYTCSVVFTNILPSRADGKRKQPENPITIETNLLVKQFLHGLRLATKPPLHYRKALRSVFIAEELRRLGANVISPIFAERFVNYSLLYLGDLNQLVQEGERAIDGKLFVSEAARGRYNFIETPETRLLYMDFRSLRNWQKLSLQLAKELKQLHSLGYILARGEHFGAHSREELVLPFWFFILDSKNKARPIAVDTGNFQHIQETARFIEGLNEKRANGLKAEDADNLLARELSLKGKILDRAMRQYRSENGIKPASPPFWARSGKPKTEGAFMH